MSKRIIQHVSVEPDGGLQIGHYDPDTDITHTKIVDIHTLIVPIGGEYDDGIDAVMETLQALLVDVLEDFHNLPKLGDPE